MPHDVRAYLTDIMESCQAITEVLGGFEAVSYKTNRFMRSSVERAFNHRRGIDPVITIIAGLVFIALRK